jgi:hypothetical protein
MTWWGKLLMVLFVAAWMSVFVVSCRDVTQELGGKGGDRTAVANVPVPALELPTAAPARPSPTPSPLPTQPHVYFHDCEDAAKAKALPLHRGDPGYRSGLDSDRDGKACENFAIR